MILYFVIVATLVIAYHHVLLIEYTDWKINVAQGRVDAGRCLLLLHELEHGEVSDQAFDLPFIMKEHQPTYWWYAVWHWDFQARTATMILANEFTTIIEEGYQ